MSRTEQTNDCRLEQTWYAGDVHFNERIELRADSTGTWVESGMGSDKPPVRKEFTWSRTDSTLTVDDHDQHKTVDFRIEPRRTYCTLTFAEHPFLSDNSGYLAFENRW